jgi:hypothetical protein
MRRDIKKSTKSVIYGIKKDLTLLLVKMDEKRHL